MADAPVPKRPRQINIALVLMWGSLIGGMVYGFADVANETDEVAVFGALIFGGAVTLILIVPLVFIALGHNWARWTWAVFLATGWVLTFVFWDESFGSLNDVLVQALFAALDIAAVYLMFSGPGAGWFKRPRNA